MKQAETTVFLMPVGVLLLVLFMWIFGFYVELTSSIYPTNFLKLIQQWVVLLDIFVVFIPAGTIGMLLASQLKPEISPIDALVVSVPTIAFLIFAATCGGSYYEYVVAILLLPPVLYSISRVISVKPLLPSPRANIGNRYLNFSISLVTASLLAFELFLFNGQTLHAHRFGLFQVVIITTVAVGIVARFRPNIATVSIWAVFVVYVLFLLVELSSTFREVFEMLRSCA